MAGRPVVVLHGGTGYAPKAPRFIRYRQRLRAIGRLAFTHLQTHSALETVAYAVRLLEDDPLFNAGTGSTVQRDGQIRMSASIMDGESLRFAGVLNIQRVRNPVLVAQSLLRQTDRVLAGDEATRYARSQGHKTWNPLTPERKRQWQQRLIAHRGHVALKHTGPPGSTVGAVACDEAGRLAAATSTGGKGFEIPGRVSDSGLPVGNYATPHAAISCTGLGEEILEEGLAVRIAQRVLDGLPLRRAFDNTFRELSNRQRHLGAIAVDRKGHCSWSTTLPILLAVAYTPTKCVEPEDPHP